MLGSSEEIKEARGCGQVVSDTTDGGFCILPLSENICNEAALHLGQRKVAPKVACADDTQKEHDWNARGIEQFDWEGSGVTTNPSRLHLQFNSEVL